MQTWMGAAALTDHLNPALILAHARAWIGTPFAPRTALRGVRADCVGLLRGIWAELSGQGGYDEASGVGGSHD